MRIVLPENARLAQITSRFKGGSTSSRFLRDKSDKRCPGSESKHRLTLLGFRPE